jgi:hypothetical protein
MFKTPWVQTIFWGQLAGKPQVLSDSCGGSVLHGSEVYLAGMGTQSDPTLEGFRDFDKHSTPPPSFFQLLLHEDYWVFQKVS